MTTVAAAVPRGPIRPGGRAEVLYPVVIPITFIVLVWGESDLNAALLVRPIVISTIATVALLVLLSIVAGDRRLGALAVTALLTACLVDQPVAKGLLIIIALAVLLIGHVTHHRELPVLATVTRVLATITALMLVVTIGRVATTPGIGSDLFEALIAPPGPGNRPMPTSHHPDIFVIMLDGYPGRTAQAKLPGLGRDEVSDALEARGFTVHPDARTDYLITRLVLASVFAERPIDEIPSLAPPYGPDQAADTRRLRQTIEQSAGIADLRTAGYDMMWVSSGWVHIDPLDVDRWVEAPGPNEFELVLVRQSGIGAILQTIDADGVADVVRSQIHGAFDGAIRIAGEPHERPRFVFVHVPSPHPPLVFRADGGDLDDDRGSTWDQMRDEVSGDRAPERIAGNVQGAASVAITEIDRLLAVAAPDSVVVVFSDHGTNLDWDETHPLSSDLDQRTSAILAARTPGRPDLFREPASPMNILGTITNGYLGTAVPWQPPRTFGYDGSVLNVVPIEVAAGD